MDKIAREARNEDFDGIIQNEDEMINKFKDNTKKTYSKAMKSKSTTLIGKMLRPLARIANLLEDSNGSLNGCNNLKTKTSGQKTKGKPELFFFARTIARPRTPWAIESER